MSGFRFPSTSTDALADPSKAAALLDERDRALEDYLSIPVVSSGGGITEAASYYLGADQTFASAGGHNVKFDSSSAVYSRNTYGVLDSSVLDSTNLVLKPGTDPDYPNSILFTQAGTYMVGFSIVMTDTAAFAYADATMHRGYWDPATSTFADFPVINCYGQSTASAPFAVTFGGSAILNVQAANHSITVKATVPTTASKIIKGSYMYAWKLGTFGAANQ